LPRGDRDERADNGRKTNEPSSDLDHVLRVSSGGAVVAVAVVVSPLA
jgi:hypothetical protein